MKDSQYWCDTSRRWFLPFNLHFLYYVYFLSCSCSFFFIHWWYRLQSLFFWSSGCIQESGYQLLHCNSRCYSRVVESSHFFRFLVQQVLQIVLTKSFQVTTSSPSQSFTFHYVHSTDCFQAFIFCCWRYLRQCLIWRCRCCLQEWRNISLLECFQAFNP